MKPRKITLSALLFLAVTLASCGSMRRLGKDLTIGATTPVWMLYGGGTDAVSTAREVRAGLGGGAATEVITMIPAFVLQAIKHGIYGVVHIADAALFPAYAVADIHPYGPEIEPLDIYTGTWFDREDGDSGTDPQSGEDRN